MSVNGQIALAGVQSQAWYGGGGGSEAHAAARRLARATAFIESVRWLAEELVVLGGRPVSRAHLDDLEEPVPTLHPCH